MHRFAFKFSLAGLLFSVALLAVSCAALVAATPLIASAAHTLNLALLALAIVGAICRQGRARTYWVAVAVVGWLYYFAAVAWPAPPEPPKLQPSYPSYAIQPSQDYRPDLLTTQVAELVGIESRTPRLPIGAHVLAQWMGGGYWPGKITDANETGYQITWDDGSSPTWDTPAQIASSTTPFYQVGHAEFGILLALLAGWLLSSVFRDPTKVEN